MVKPDFGQSSYRRGVMLGLTLAELLLLLLFLFLLITTTLLFRRAEETKKLQDQIIASESERIAIRTALGNELALPAGTPPAHILTKEELETPLANIRALAAQRDNLSDQLGAAQSALAQARMRMSDPESAANRLAEEVTRLTAALNRKANDDAENAALRAKAVGIDPNTTPSETMDRALDSITKSKLTEKPADDPVKQCLAEVDNLKSRVRHAELACRSGDYPPCVYRDDGRAAYVFDVSLTQFGIYVRQGDTGSYQQLVWVKDLPQIPFDSALSIDQFVSGTLPYLIAGDAQDPKCRFHIRVRDNMGAASREEFKRAYLGVQTNFYHHLER